MTELSSTRTLLVVLAAGEGSRFEGPTHKLLAPFGSGTVISMAVGAAVEAVHLGGDQVIGPLVVAGAVDLEAAVGPLLKAPGAAIVANPRWAEGQASSLQVAIAEAEQLGVDAVVVAPGDQPLLDPADWLAVSGAIAPIATGEFDSTGSQRLRRPPVRLHRSVWASLPTTGDEGARVLMRSGEHPVEAVPCHGNPADIDSISDLQDWANVEASPEPDR